MDLRMWHSRRHMSNPVDPSTRPINWPTVLFILGTSLGALAWPVYAWNFGVTWSEIILAIVYFYATGMAITVA
jgi:hypothetical protein